LHINLEVILPIDLCFSATRACYRVDGMCWFRWCKLQATELGR